MFRFVGSPSVPRSSWARSRLVPAQQPSKAELQIPAPPYIEMQNCPRRWLGKKNSFLPSFPRTSHCRKALTEMFYFLYLGLHCLSSQSMWWWIQSWQLDLEREDNNSPWPLKICWCLEKKGQNLWVCFIFFFLRNCWKTRIQLIKYVPLKISPVGSFSNYRQAIQTVDIPETSGVCSLLSFGSKSVFSAVHVFMLLVLVGKLCWMILLGTDISWLLRKTQSWALPIYLAYSIFLIENTRYLVIHGT